MDNKLSFLNSLKKKYKSDNNSNKNSSNGSSNKNSSNGSSNKNSSSGSSNKNTINKISNGNKSHLLSAINNLIKTEEDAINNLDKRITTLDDELLFGKKMSFYKKYKNIIISVIFLIILIIIGIILYLVYKKYFSKKSLDSQKLHIMNHDSGSTQTIDNDDIVEPINGYDYSITFWLYISDIYKNIGVWRNILHKGIDNIDKKYATWEELEKDLLVQRPAPSIWLHPSKSEIRFVVTVNPDKSKHLCDISKTQTDCDEQTPPCKWDTYHDKCVLDVSGKKKHHENIMYSKYDDGELLQYVNINVPIKKATHLAFVFENRILNIYENGKLSETATFLGEPVLNKDAMNLSSNPSFGGNLFDFNYYPYTISSEKVATLADNLPNDEVVPAQRRFTHHLKNANFLKAIRSYF